MDRGRSRSRRGRNRNERTKDVSADSSDPSSNANEPDITVTEQPHPRTTATERKSNKKKFVQPPDLDSAISMLSEDQSAIEQENPENPNVKPDDRRRARRHRSNKNRNPSAHAKNSIDDQNLVAEESPDTPIDSENSSADLQSNVEKIIPIKEKPAVAAPRKHSVKKRVAETPVEVQSTPMTIDEKVPLTAATKSPEPIAVKELPDFTKSGLVMVETPPEKVEMVTEEIILPKRPRKRIKEAVDMQAEPLMQVETRE